MNDLARISKLSLIVSSGAFDKIHYALVLASAAAATGTPVTLFFTMHACHALKRPGADGRAAWRDLPVSGPGGPGDPGGPANGGDMDDGFKEKGVGAFEELLDACREFGVRFLVCEMGLRAMDLAAPDLRGDIPFEHAGAVTFLGDARPDGQIIFI